MTDTDKELLELAAKAAGLRVTFDGDNPPYPRATEDGHWNPSWSPLTDDGDALRLAVKLNIQFAPDKWTSMVTAFIVNEHCDPIEATICVEFWGGDPYTATRRAIVRAAATIAKES